MPFLESPALANGAHDAFFALMPVEHSASLLDHCALALDQCLTLPDINSLPLIGTGDWNDGMNRMGEAGGGESVWLGCFLLRTIMLISPIVEQHQPGRAKA